MKQQTFGRVSFFNVEGKGYDCNGKKMNGEQCENKAVVGIKDGKLTDYFCSLCATTPMLESVNYEK